MSKHLPGRGNEGTISHAAGLKTLQHDMSEGLRKDHLPIREKNDRNQRQFYRCALPTGVWVSPINPSVFLKSI